MSTLVVQQVRLVRRGCWPTRECPDEHESAIICPLCSVEHGHATGKTAYFVRSGHIYCITCNRASVITTDDGIQLLPERLDISVLSLLELAQDLKRALNGDGDLLTMVKMVRDAAAPRAFVLGPIIINEGDTDTIRDTTHHTPLHGSRPDLGNGISETIRRELAGVRIPALAL